MGTPTLQIFIRSGTSVWQETSNAKSRFGLEIGACGWDILGLRSRVKSRAELHGRFNYLCMRQPHDQTRLCCTPSFPHIDNPALSSTFRTSYDPEHSDPAQADGRVVMEAAVTELGLETK